MTEKPRTGLPQALKIALVEQGISFNAWCAFYGFNISTARQVAGGKLSGKWGEKTSQIQSRLHEDFPAAFSLDGDGLTQDKLEWMREHSFASTAP